MSRNEATVRVTPDVQDVFDTIIKFKLPHPDDPAVHEAMQADAGREAAKVEIILTDQGMTPGMRDNSSNLVRDRLADFETAAATFDTAVRPHLEGMRVLEDLNRDIETAKDESRAIEARIAATYEAKIAFRDARTNHETSDRLWQDYYERQGERMPRMFNAYLYGVILVLIGSLEWLVNYGSFLENWGAPAMAAGFTIAVAAAVAFASHEHGTLLKQREFYFGPAVEGFNRTSKLIWVGVASAALLVAFYFVGWNRYNWAIEILAKTGGGGTLGPIIAPVNVTQKVTMSLLANVIVWFLGVAVAYWVHDPNPKLVALNKRRLEHAKVWRKQVSAMEEEIRTARAQLVKNIEELENRAKAMSSRFRPLTDLGDQVRTKREGLHREARTTTLRLAQNYQRLLVRLAGVKNPDIVFIGDTKMTLEEFSRVLVSIELPRDQHHMETA